MNKPQKGFAGLEALLILIIVAILAFTGWYVYKSRSGTDKLLNSAAGQSAAAGSNAKSASSPDTSLTKGTDNSSLQSDLNNINSSQNQAGNDYNSSGTTLNDQQNEISVPTN